MAKRIYIETSIPSFYYDNRPQPEFVACRNWTREWWDKHCHDHELFISDPVLFELENGDYPNKKEVIKLVEKLTILPINDEISEMTGAYIDHKAMPKDPTGDAMHLALATYHKCDFLLTWNCNHLANPNKFSHIRLVNVRLGFNTPYLVTPFQFLGGLEL